MTVDTLYSGLATGAVSQKDYKAAMDNFDMLSKSANFAACKKKDGGSATVLPLGEVVEYLEQHKKIKVKKNAWSADAVTGIMGDLYHVVESLGLERM